MPLWGPRKPGREPTVLLLIASYLLLVFVLPAVLFNVAMVIFPTFFGLYIAFTDWNLSSFEGRRFSGLKNLYDLFNDQGARSARVTLPAGRRVAIVTNAGGPAILCADACEAEGLAVEPPSVETKERLAAFLPAEAACTPTRVDQPARPRSPRSRASRTSSLSGCRGSPTRVRPCRWCWLSGFRRQGESQTA